MNMGELMLKRSGHWSEPVLHEYNKAVLKFQEHHLGVTAPRFWELSWSLDESVLVDVVTGLVREIQIRPIASHPFGTSVLLRYILRTHLSDVHGNHLWPEVERMLYRTTGLILPSAKVQTFFRESLLQCHAAELPAHKNRFVMFLLKDVGIGYKRSSLVAAFLEDLLVHRVLHHSIPWTVMLSEKIDRITDPDLVPLIPVLEDTGGALLAIAEFSDRHATSLPSPTASWHAIREYWWKTLKIDLDRLLPESRRILEPILPRVAKHSTRTKNTLQVSSNHVSKLLIANVSQSGLVWVGDSQEVILVESTTPLDVSPKVEICRCSEQSGAVYRTELAGWKCDPVTIHADSTTWIVVNASSFRLGGMDFCVQNWGHLNIKGTGITPLPISKIDRLYVMVPESWDTEILEIMVQIPGKELFKVKAIDHQGFLAYLRESGTGLVNLGIRYHGVECPRRYQLYVFAEKPLIEPSSLEEFSTLSWRDRDGKIIRLIGIPSNDSPSSVSAVFAVNKGNTLICNWIPDVADAVLYADESAVAAGTTVWLGQVQQMLTLSISGFEKRRVEIKLDDYIVTYPGALTSVLNDILIQRIPNSLMLSVQFEHTQRCSFSTKPVSISCSAVWSGTQQICGTMSWIGLTQHAPQLTIEGVFGEIVNIEDHGAIGPLGYHQFVADVVWNMTDIAIFSTDLPIYVLDPFGNIKVGDVALSPDHERNAVRHQILDYINHPDNHTSPWTIVYLTERFLRITGKLPCRTDRLVRRLSMTLDGEARGAIRALRLLDALVQDRPMPQVPLKLEGVDAYAEVFYATLLLLNHVRLYRQGLANPSILRQLVDEMIQKIEDKCVGEWCRLMVGYCATYTDIGNLDVKIPLSLSKPPLVFFDDHFRQWFNTLQINEGRHV